VYCLIVAGLFKEDGCVGDGLFLLERLLAVFRRGIRAQVEKVGFIQVLSVEICFFE
jgi:hypothetical protein